MRHHNLLLLALLPSTLLLGASPPRPPLLSVRALDGGHAVVHDVRIRALVIAPGGTIYAGGTGTGSVVDSGGQIVNPNGPRGSAFLVSHNHGATWTIRMTPTAHQSPVWTDHSRWPIAFLVNQLAVDPHSPTTIYAAGLSNAGGNHYMLRSRDGGRSWQDVLIWKRVVGHSGDWMLTTNIVVTPATRRVLTNRLVRVGAALAIDPRAPHHLYLGTESLGVLRSLDGGASWLYNPGSPSVELGVAEQLVIDPKHPQVLYALVQGTTFARLYRTDDSGVSWRLLWHGDYTSGLSLEAQTLYLPRSDGIYASTDRGSHWRLAVNARTLPGFTLQTSFGNAGTLVQALHHQGIWYVVDNNAVKPAITGLFGSPNNGTSWHLLTSGLRGPRGALAGPVEDGSQTVAWLDGTLYPNILFTASQLDGLYRWSMAP